MFACINMNQFWFWRGDITGNARSSSQTMWLPFHYISRCSSNRNFVSSIYYFFTGIFQLFFLIVQNNEIIFPLFFNFTKLLWTFFLTLESKTLFRRKGIWMLLRQLEIWKFSKWKRNSISLFIRSQNTFLLYFWFFSFKN